MPDMDEMDKHLHLKERHYVVPPSNTVRVTVEVSLRGEPHERWYTSVSDLDSEEWIHRRGASSGHNTEEEAMTRARALWAAERAKASGASVP